MGKYYELKRRGGPGKCEAHIRRGKKARFLSKKAFFAPESMVNSDKWYQIVVHYSIRSRKPLHSTHTATRETVSGQHQLYGAKISQYSVLNMIIVFNRKF